MTVRPTTPDGTTNDSVRWFAETSIDDVQQVGGKNASLGEMYRQLADAGVRVPNGFATTADAFHRFIEDNELGAVIAEALAGWDRVDVDDLTTRAAGIRSRILAAELPADLVDQVRLAYRDLSAEVGQVDVPVAVRSSATAEDLPEASFAGQQETYLMIHGESALLAAIQRCFASLYTARAIAYRRDFEIDERGIALSAGVQHMVRADQASSGVIFTLDPESGCRDVVYITGAWGLGENIVQGRVIPDGFHVHKERLRDGFAPLVGKEVGAKELRMTFDEANDRVINIRTSEAERARLCLDDDEVIELARWATMIEDHYTESRGVATPMDIEWAKDGPTGQLYIVQARPETVHSQRAVTSAIEIHRLERRGEVLATGFAIGDRIATGRTRVVADPKDMRALQEGDVLVTDTTDPDWEPILKRASAVVTERGGRTSHAAIVARELGIPAVVGVENARALIGPDREVTVSCAEGEVGFVYDTSLPHTIDRVDMEHIPTTRTEVMVNLGDPGSAYRTAMLPTAGIGLARMEFIFASHVGVHPLALLHPEELTPEDRSAVARVTAAYDRPVDFLIDRVALGVGTLAAAFWPRPVILRFSDFKTNEYAGLLGGRGFEPVEENPMLGWRGASRYYHDDYREGFELELAAVAKVRREYGLTNLKVMVPFCRTPAEGRQVIEVMAANGLVQGEDGLDVYVMCELPANVLQADAFASVFDGFSIGSNDLTQLILGVDRDSERVAGLFDEREPAVKRACAMAIGAAKEHGRKIGICGQAPSDYPDFATFLVEEGIDSISVTPDMVLKTITTVHEAEKVVDEAASGSGSGQPIGPGNEEGLAHYRAALGRLLATIEAEPVPEVVTLREVAEAELSAVDEVGSGHQPGHRLREAIGRFETEHPDLTKAINDVSYHLSGLGI